MSPDPKVISNRPNSVEWRDSMVKTPDETMPSLVDNDIEIMEVDPTNESTNQINGHAENDSKRLKLMCNSTNGHGVDVTQILLSWKDAVVKSFQESLSSNLTIDTTFSNATAIVHQTEETSMKLLRFVSSNSFLFKTPLNSLRTHPYLKNTNPSQQNELSAAKPAFNNLLQGATQPTQSDGLEILNTVSAKEVNLPPRGEMIRSPVEVGSRVFAMKTSLLGVWVKGIVTYVKEPTSEQPEKTFKVRYDIHKSNVIRSYSAKQLAYESTSSVIVPVGTRIIAQYTDSLGRKASYAGIIAEPPKATNKRRYLIFFDDGCAQYVTHDDVHVVCAQSADVGNDVYEHMSEFVRSYLSQYPERPMVRLSTGQIVKTEYNTEWFNAKVLEVDASLVQMLFVNSNRTEWIYRGSARLSTLQNALASAEAHRLEGKNRRRHAVTPRRPHEPYVEYTREDVVTLDSDSEEENKLAAASAAAKDLENVENKKPRNTARKSLATRPLSTLNTVNLNFRANSVYRLPDKKSHLGYKEVSRIVSYARTPFYDHDCGIQCREKDPPSKWKGKNPLLIPIYMQWERQLRRYRVPGTGLQNIITYRAPCGRHLRNLEDVLDYLTLVQSRLTIDLFSFNQSLLLFRAFRPKDILFKDDDITQGRENVPVSCINSLSDEPPPFVEYSAERFPGEGVFLNLDQEFLCGCSCTDNCKDPERCECQRNTSNSIFSTQYGTELGYKHRRLTEPVISGIYECNVKCKCNSSCGNRVVQNGLTVRLQMFKTQFKGWGIRCLDDVDAGQFICVYAGQLLTEQGADADGKECGDEYLAELDHIEVVEKAKEGYESDVPEMYGRRRSKTDSSSDDNYNSDMEDSDVVLDSDSDIESSLRTTASSNYAMRSRKRNGSKGVKSPKDIRASLLTSDDSDSSNDSIKRDKGLPDISTSLDLFSLSPRELSPDSAAALERTELKRKPKIESKGSGKVAKKSLSVKSNYPCESESRETKFVSVRNYYGENSLYIMDAKSKGNIGRYLNHSCEPNVFVQNVFVDTHDLRFPAVAFFAYSAIDAGTELTWDYNYEVGSVTDKVMYCYCEAASCRGRLL